MDVIPCNFVEIKCYEGKVSALILQQKSPKVSPMNYPPLQLLCHACRPILYIESQTTLKLKDIISNKRVGVIYITFLSIRSHGFIQMKHGIFRKITAFCNPINKPKLHQSSLYVFHQFSFQSFKLNFSSLVSTSK